MDLIKRDSEHTKKNLTNLFINDVGHLIGENISN